MESTLEPLPVNVRIKISALWASMLFAPAVVYALSIVGGAIGEWSYYVLGSAVEVGLLAAIVYYAWSWPKARRNASIG